MKAEDTVMTHEIMLAEIWDLGFGLEGAEGRPPTQKERFERIAKVQTEITWDKAIREVVGWVESLEDAPTYSVCEGTNIKIPEPPSKLVLNKELKAQKKVWGIKNE